MLIIIKTGIKRMEQSHQRYITIKTFAKRAGTTDNNLRWYIRAGKLHLAQEVEHPSIDTTKYNPETYWRDLYMKQKGPLSGTRRQCQTKSRG